MDVHTPAQRSFNMSRIYSKNTSSEVKLRKFLSATGIRGYRLHYKITGKPDIVFPKKKIAIFIDGCFWHRCKYHFVSPKTNKKFWLPKIKRNLVRDKEVNRTLKVAGWQVVRIWEHEVENDAKKISAKINKEIVI